MSELDGVLQQLKREHTRVTDQLHQLNQAIQALGKVAGGVSTVGGVVRVKRHLSLAARKKIAAAQRLRWERVRAKAKKAA